MRKSPTSALFELFGAENDDTRTNLLKTSDNAYIIDDGMLLHRVRWTRNESLQAILNKYVSYLKKNFWNDIIVLFDGSSFNFSSTKSAERSRRSNGTSSAGIVFIQNTIITVQQDKLLGNINNKTRFIKYLTQSLQENNIIVKQAEDDVDCLIVHTALGISCHFSVIVSKDTDVLVLTIALTPINKMLYFLKIWKQENDSTVHSSKNFDEYPFCKKHILFLQTGCFEEKSSKNCTCKKAGLSCSNACGHCQTGNCVNSERMKIIDDSEDDSDSEVENEDFTPKDEE